MTKHTGTPIGKPQWWKHLRGWKKVFWKRDRRAGKPAWGEPGCESRGAGG